MYSSCDGFFINSYLRFLLNIINTQSINTLHWWARHWYTRRQTTSRRPETFRVTTPIGCSLRRVRSRLPLWSHVIVAGPDYAAHMTLPWRVHSVAKLRPQLYPKIPKPSLPRPPPRPPLQPSIGSIVSDFSSAVPINGTVSISVVHQRIRARTPRAEACWHGKECSSNGNSNWVVLNEASFFCSTRAGSWHSVLNWDQLGASMESKYNNRYLPFTLKCFLKTLNVASLVWAVHVVCLR